MDNILRKAWHIVPGNIKNLRIEEESLPDPGPGEVQVHVHALGLNFADIFTLLGLYKAAPKDDFIPGLEYSGTITKIGTGVTGFQKGERVMGISRFGAWVSDINIDSRYIVQLPEGWSFSEGAGFLVQVLTAYYALVELGRLQKGETVLIHSAAGGVGTQANRIAKTLGAYTIGTVGHVSKLPVLQKEGWDKGIVRTKDFARDLKEALGVRKLNIVMECIGGSILMDGLKQLGIEGRMIIYGSASFSTPGDKVNMIKLLWKYLFRPKIDPLKLPNSNKSIMGFNLIWLYPQVEKMHRILSELEKLDLSAPLIGQEYSFNQLPDAIRDLHSGKTVGKLIVTVP
jgi:alcohol dehydrogenase